MKLAKVLFAAALVAPLGLGITAEAGSIGFTARDGITADGSLSGAIDGATVFTFATVEGGANSQTTVEPATGIFAGIAAGTVATSSALDLSVAGGTAAPFLTLTFNGLEFRATEKTYDFFANNGRQINFKGVVTGASLGGDVAATFIISFTQAGGPGDTISYSGTLAAVPEPSSVALLAAGGLGLAAVARRRRAASRA